MRNIRLIHTVQEETMISEQLTIILKKNHKHEEITEYPEGIFETTLELEVWDVRRVKIIIELAVTFEASGEYFKAEELYIFLWKRLIEHSHHHHHHHGVEVHISMIDIAIEYVRFLRRRNRHEEACSILICLWTEYEEYTFESVDIFLRLKMVGEIMRAISLLSIAVSVFRKCWGWFSSHGHHEHVASCEVLISETVQEIITTTTKTTTTTTTTETVIKELFESSISRTTVTSETISICKGLISLYMKLEQWSQAIEVTQRSLTLIWRMVLSGGAICALPTDFGSEAIEIAMYLAICHHRSHHYHESEEIYIRIYRACLNSCDVHDERLIKSYTVLIKFYEESRHWHKMIHIYQEMLEQYRKHLGVSHALTIKTLYILASLCADHGHGSALSYYEEIVLVINGKSRVCHHDAREALMVLCRIYYEEGHWTKLHETCVVLWETWTHHHHEHKFSHDFIELLYIRYRYVLEHHIHCEYEVLRTITIQYRETCIKFFGASVSITIKALLEFAQLCLKSEKYIHEAITTYEEVSSVVAAGSFLLLMMSGPDQNDDNHDDLHYHHGDIVDHDYHDQREACESVCYCV
jgi:pentatricopeptide repeat protein